MYAIGIDSGSSATKGVVICDGVIVAHHMLPTGYNPSRTMGEMHEILVDAACAHGGIKREKMRLYTVTTGYGRDLLALANKRVTEITCHAKGAAFLAPGTSCVIDIGGQDSKVILMDEGETVVDFLMNDKCAAGTGRFMEVIMRILHRDLEDLDGFIRGQETAKISSMCTVFAESEVISLLAQNVMPQAIARGVVASICTRTSHFAHRLPIREKVFFSGGLSQSKEIQTLLSEALGLEVFSHDLCQYTGAIGAAVIGARHLEGTTP